MWLNWQNRNPKPPVEHLGKLESELMERLWDRTEISVRDLHGEIGGRLAYTTIMTTLDRLYKKGLLNRKKAGKAFLYAPVMSREEYRDRQTEHLLNLVLQDNQDSNAVLSCFINVVSESDQKMLDKLDELVKAKRRALRRQE
jgi:predicted transcriptional regulator